MCENLDGIEVKSNCGSDLFNLITVEKAFKTSLIDNEDVEIGSYLEGYKELCKFCWLMGSVFTFVCSEIRSKMDILILQRNNDKENNFKSMKSMVKYEEENNLLSDTKYVSGCRTFLRLHRGLDFLRNFLRRVGELEPHENTNGVGQEVYRETLGKYHPWLVRKGATVAMYALPTRENLLKKVCGEDYILALECLPSMLEATNEVYNRTEAYFLEKNLLNLP